jgi:hypothetical protein
MRNNDNLYVGVIGFSPTKFDETKAKEYLKEAFDLIEGVLVGTVSQYVCVSGLTNIGVPKLAYEEAHSRGWQTWGIACSKANEFELYPVNHKIIVGDNWGDESQTFLDNIDVLIRVGGSEQSKEEVEKFKKMGGPYYEYELELLS